MSKQSQRPIDGKRYHASLQNAKDQTCFNEIFESDKLNETTERAEKEAKEAECAAIVFDRYLGFIVHRCDYNPKKEEVQKPIPQTPARRRR